jgi:hypothetical protein
MENQSRVPPKRKYSDEIVGRYTYAYFDHLHSEYLRVASTIDAEKSQNIKET